jgi:hypothetical protein
MSWRRRGVTFVLLPLLFLGSCAALVPVGMTIADPMTHIRVDSLDRPFPVLVMTGDVPRVRPIDDLRRVPKLPSGSTYLIPAGQEDVIETQLNEHLPPHAEGGWVLRVRRLAPQRQHIELYWMNDGYSGGAYEATASSFLPRYRKMTGPGFAFVFGGIASLINLVMWTVVLAMNETKSSWTALENRAVKGTNMKSTLVVLAFWGTVASATFAQTPGSPPPPRTVEPDAVTVGTAVPSGQSVVITLDERNIDRAYPEWAGAWTTTVTKEQFRSVVRDVASRKLAAMFPNGFPPDAASEMKIEIRIQLSEPHEISINIGC